MRILSLDTSFSFINVSVVEEGKLKLLHYVLSEKKTLENLPKLLSELCLRPEEFDAFAVSRGVGFLTSVRIGITFVKTWAYTLKKPVVSFENLSILGRFTPVSFPRIPYLKVSNNVFFRVLEKDREGEVKLYGGEELEGFGISLREFSDVRLGKEQFFHPFFPFSAYGGIYAYEYLLKDPSGEDVLSIEPVYVKPPA
ncbi:MAG: tRNA threonylcarbamoyladenosine biosynthesis protein TsaB [Aquificae bacterium]|nr:tRNA threonylcarbamoyladenosine biosynthesis protein TsaB [Aquificota bacterium]